MYTRTPLSVPNRFLPQHMGEQPGRDCAVRQFWGGISTPLCTNLGHTNSEPQRSHLENEGHAAISVKPLALVNIHLSLKLGTQTPDKVSFSASVGLSEEPASHLE